MLSLSKRCHAEPSNYTAFDKLRLTLFLLLTLEDY
jgi:hypothetical protein